MEIRRVLFRSVHHRFGEVEARLAARRGGVGEHLERRGEKRAGTEITERIGGVLHDLRPRGGKRAGPREPGFLHVKGVIEHQWRSEEHTSELQSLMRI